MVHFIEFPLTFKLPLLDLVKSLPNQAEHTFVWKNILLVDKTLQSEVLKLAGVMNLTEAFNCRWRCLGEINELANGFLVVAVLVNEDFRLHNFHLPSPQE